MSVHQLTIQLPVKKRGFHVITSYILNALGALPKQGILTVFILHTSAGITINEAADPDVLLDMERYFDRIVPENIPDLKHTIEGPDDMPAHVKASLLGSSVQVPIENGRLALGTWQGIILGEFRNRATPRRLLVTVVKADMGV